MSDLHIPRAVEVRNELIRDYVFSDGATLIEAAGQGFLCYDKDGERVYEPEQPDTEPFSKRVRLSRRIMSLAEDRPEILNEEETLRIIAISAGVKL